MYKTFSLCFTVESFPTICHGEKYFCSCLLGILCGFREFPQLQIVGDFSPAVLPIYWKSRGIPRASCLTNRGWLLILPWKVEYGHCVRLSGGKSYTVLSALPKFTPLGQTQYQWGPWIYSSYKTSQLHMGCSNLYSLYSLKFLTCWLLGALLQEDNIPSHHQLQQLPVLFYSLLRDDCPYYLLMASIFLL